MFEDIKKDDDRVVAGDPSAAQDVLAEVDPVPVAESAIQAGKLTPVSAVQAMEAAPSAPGQAERRVGPPVPLTNLSQLEEYGAHRRSRRGLIIAIVGLLLILGGVSAGAYWYFSSAPAAPEDATITDEEMPANTNEDPSNTVNSNEANNPTDELDNPPAVIDSDGDYLSDVEEQALGTDPLDPDTDSDGLADRDEIYVYKTNPLLADTDNDGLSDRDEIFVWKTRPAETDTDSDGYTDGEEVENGYSPTGEGKLEPGDLAQ